MKIYINALTVNSIKILLLCNAQKIKVDFELIALNKGEQRKADFLAINPDGKVPVLVDDGLTLTESNAILHYLGAKFKSHLWPSTLIEQAKVLRILFWQSSYFNSGVAPFAHRKVVIPFWGFESPDIKAKQIIRFHQSLSALESILTNNKYVSGNSMTIADISLVAFFMFAKQANMPLQNYSFVQAWLLDISTKNWFIETQHALVASLSGVYPNQ
jgi:glutathione S-transferase